MTKNNRLQWVQGSVLVAYLGSVLLMLLLSVGLWERARPISLQWQSKQLLSEMQQMLIRARWTALMTHAVVKVCGSLSGKQCDGGWNQRWLWLSASGKVLYCFKPHLKGWQWKSSSNFVQFNSGGHSAGYQRLWTLIREDRDGVAGGKLVLMHSGRVRVSFHH